MHTSGENYFKASTDKVKQPNWNKNINGCHHLEWLFWGEFLLSLCRWILTQHLLWCLNRTCCAGTCTNQSQWVWEWNSIVCFCNFSVLISNSRWWSTTRQQGYWNCNEIFLLLNPCDSDLSHPILSIKTSSR